MFKNKYICRKKEYSCISQESKNKQNERPQITMRWMVDDRYQTEDNRKGERNKGGGKGHLFQKLGQKTASG